jgi:hypothetical protein
MSRTLPTSIAILLSSALFASCSNDPASPKQVETTSDSAAEVDDLEATLRDRPTIPFSAAHVFFEFNSTDNDLGFQLMLDGEPWSKVNLVDPGRGRLIDFRARGELEKLGITELRYESAEPSPEEVLALFEPGTYKFVGLSVEGERMLGYADLSHELASAPVFVYPTDGAEVDAEDLEIRWQAIAGLAGYEVIVANEDTGRSMTVELDADATSLEVPGEFLEEGTEYKSEILAIAANGNKTITEVSFSTE